MDGEPSPIGRGSAERFRALWLAAAITLALSLFVPWWIVVGEVTDVGAIIGGRPEVGLELFAPAWAPFVLSSLGTKLSLHLQNVLILLLAAVAFLLASRFVARSSPKLSRSLVIASSCFTVTTVVLFSVFFPRVGYVGHVFWPWGSGEFSTFFTGLELRWFVFAGLFLAVASCILQVALLRAPLPIGESAPSHSTPRVRRLRAFADKRWVRFGAFPVAWVLLAAGMWGGLAYAPTISAKGFVNDWDFTHKSFEPGDRATVVGRVLNHTLVFTSYGPFTLLSLEGDDLTVDATLALPGDLRARHPVGGVASIPVHFRAYTYNGNGFTWADEGFAPVGMILSFSVVFSAVSAVAGVPILAERGPAGDRLRIYVPHAFPLDAFTASLTRAGFPYVSETGLLSTLEPPAGAEDRMVPLRHGSSENATFRFLDENTNGQLDWGDAFELNVPATQSPTALDTYILAIHGPVAGFVYVVVRERGPLLFYLGETFEATTYHALTMPPDETVGASCASRVEVARFVGDPAPTADYAVRLTDSTMGTVLAEVPADRPVTVLPGGGRMRYEDLGAVGLLDEGDAWAIEGLTNLTRYDFALLRAPDRERVAGVTWVCGIGQNIASRPRITLRAPTPDPGDPQATIVEVATVEWMPAGNLFDYRVELERDGARLLPATGLPARLVPQVLPPPPVDPVLPVGPSEDGAGTWLTFVDADGNGYLTPGDRFRVNSTAASSEYRLLLYYGITTTMTPITAASWRT